MLHDARSLGTSVVYLLDYWERAGTGPVYPHYWNKGDYDIRADLGGEPALMEGIRRLHDEGGKVIMYVEPFIVWKDSRIGKESGARWAGRYPHGHPLGLIAAPGERGQEWPIYDHCYTMVPALREWQDHVIGVAKRLVETYGADGIFLDSFGWQMNLPMRTSLDGRDRWPGEYARGVLELADRVMAAIGPTGSCWWRRRAAPWAATATPA